MECNADDSEPGGRRIYDGTFWTGLCKYEYTDEGVLQASDGRSDYSCRASGSSVDGGYVVIETDAAENIKVTKAKSKEKIDGIVASIMALDRCIRNQGKTQGSVYDERGLLVF